MLEGGSSQGNKITHKKANNMVPGNDEWFIYSSRGSLFFSKGGCQGKNKSCDSDDLYCHLLRPLGYSDIDLHVSRQLGMSPSFHPSTFSPLNGKSLVSSVTYTGISVDPGSRGGSSTTGI